MSLHNSHAYHKSQEQWVKQDEITTVLFAEVATPEKLEEVLRRAQAALLHPSKEWKYFTTCPITAIERLPGVDFSPCQVRVVVTAPNVHTLAFYDLPGLIQQTPSDRQKHLPNLVRQMVSEYISAPKTIILLVTPMTNDPDNSAAAGLIEKLKAKHRTMAVLTKPDRLEKGIPLGPLEKILSGDEDAFPVGHGYYVTKQPDQQQLNQHLSRQDAREEETRFFTTQEPWSTDLAHHHARFGTESIRKKLSTLLFEAIKSNLPEMSDKIDHRIKAIDEQLKHIPKRLSDDRASKTIDQLLNKVAGPLSSLLHGLYPHADCINNWNSTTVNKLRRSLAMTKPQLDVPGGCDTIELISDDDDDDDSSISTPTKKRSAASFNKLTLSPPKKQKMSPRKSESEAEELLPYTLTPAKLDGIKHSVHANGLRDSIDPRAITQITKPALDKWNMPVEDFLMSTHKVVMDWMTSLFRDVLGRYSTAPIVDDLSKAAGELLEQVMNGVAQHIVYTLTAEQLTTMIVVKDEAFHKKFALTVQEETDLINKSRRKALIKQYFDNLDKQSGKKTTDKDRKSKADKLRETDLSEPFHAQIKLLATANAALSTSIEHTMYHVKMQTRFAIQRLADENSGLVARLIVEWDKPGKSQSLLEVNAEQAKERLDRETERTKLVDAQRTLAAVL